MMKKRIREEDEEIVRDVKNHQVIGLEKKLKMKG
jgi:hypothetical protein